MRSQAPRGHRFPRKTPSAIYFPPFSFNQSPVPPSPSQPSDLQPPATADPDATAPAEDDWWPPAPALAREIRSWPGLAAPMAAKFQAAGVLSIDQLLWHPPLRHEDRRDQFGGRIQPGADQALVVRILSSQLKRLRRGLNLFEARVEVEALAGRSDAQLLLRWWRMPYLQRQLAEGMRLVVYGRVKEERSRVSIDQPEFEILDETAGAEGVHWGRIVPVYGRREGVPQRNWRELVAGVLDTLTDADFGERLPAGDLRDFGFAGRRQIFQALHFPDRDEQVHAARRVLALEQLCELQGAMLRRRRQRRSRGHRDARPAWPDNPLDPFLSQLPFTLTDAQQRVLDEITRDLSAARPMTRLLQGDVGSGKTVVAMAAIWLCVRRGQQAALMAPTQILAEQLHQVALRWLAGHGLNVALRTGGRRSSTGDLPLFSGQTDDDRPDVVVGTHALLFEDDWWSRLGLAVIDEQHKFGVAQRQRLLDKAGGHVPDVLVMTATPIPRTLQLTLYGDLDVSVIDHHPEGRGRLSTAVRLRPDADAMAAFINTRVEAGERVYLVYPRIDEEQDEDIDPGADGETAADDAGGGAKPAPPDKVANAHPLGALEAWQWWTRQLAPVPVALLHGRMKADEKSAVIDRFRRGEQPVLVGTQVIEVGVDVPEATVMIIFHAERFGLAQLHQLRGRVGRAGARSWCVLVSHCDDPTAMEKLDILRRHRDGFAIAEADLHRRGPGNVIGREQSGRAPLVFPELAGDLELVTRARRIAEARVGDS